ncbi:hypothetical protein PAXRUDRAFT_173852, partial [Paxillus rubicundulus Ve08.2h10]
TWEFIGVLLGDGDMEKEVDGETPAVDDEPSAGSDSDDSYWDEVDEIDLEGFINGLTGEGGRACPKRTGMQNDVLQS